MPSKRAWLGEINKGLKDSQARESKAVQIRVKNLQTQAENERKRNAAYEKSKAQIDAAYGRLRVGRFKDAHELLTLAQRTQVEAGNHEAAERIAGIVFSAGQVADAIGEIKKIQDKYPPQQRSRVGVHLPEKQDNAILYRNHRLVAQHFPVLFGEPLEDSPYAMEHFNEAGNLEQNYRVILDNERKYALEKTLSNWSSSKDARWHLLKGEHELLSGSPGDATMHYSAALSMCPPERDSRSLRYIMRHGGEDAALAALKRAAPKGENPKEYSERILEAYKSMAFAEVMRQVGGFMAPNQGNPITSIVPFLRKPKTKPI